MTSEPSEEPRAQQVPDDERHEELHHQHERAVAIDGQRAC